MYLFLKARQQRPLTTGFIPIFLIVIIALIAIPITTFLVKQQQDIRQKAYFPSEGGGGKTGCPNPPPEGGTNSCVPTSWFSSCPGGSYPYGSPDGDSDCTAAAGGASSMCCYAPPAATSTPVPSCTYGSCINEGYKTQSGDPSGYYICQSGCNQYESCPSGTTFNDTTKSCGSVLSCAQKYGDSGYNCMPDSTNECIYGSKQSKVGTNCEDDILGPTSCCKAAPPPTPTPTSSWVPLTCAQRYNDSGYQCMLTSTSECQFGTNKSTAGTNCTDSAGFDVSCCKAAVPTSTPTPTSLLLTCATKYGDSGYGCYDKLDPECTSPNYNSTAIGTSCFNGGLSACCKVKPITTSTPQATGQCPPTNPDGTQNTCRLASQFTSLKCSAGEVQIDDGGYCTKKNLGIPSSCCNARPPVYQCGSDKTQPASCFDAFSGCPTDTQQSAHEPGTSCNASGQVCCNRPYQCESSGGRCINPFGSTCTNLESQFSGTSSSCGTTNQVCCLPKRASQPIYERAFGYYCVNDIIFNLGTGATINSPNAIDCKKEGKSCIEFGAHEFTYYTCLAKDSLVLKEITRPVDEINHCGTGEDKNKIYGLGQVIGTDVNGNPTYTNSINVFHKDCAQENKVCTNIGQTGICSEILFSSDSQPQPPSRVTKDGGIKQGANEVNTIANSLNEDYFNDNSHGICHDENIMGWNPRAMKWILVKDCKEKGLSCIEQDQKVMCGAPIIVNSTPINHMYCGDNTNTFGFDISISNTLAEGLQDYMLQVTGTGTVYAFTQFLQNPRAEYPSQIVVSGVSGKAGTLSQEGLEIALISRGATALIAKNVSVALISHIGLWVNPGSLKTFYTTASNLISYHQRGNNFDYWTCGGNKLEKLRIDVDTGKQNYIEQKDCPTGTQCTIFNDSCVVCAKKTTASAPVLGVATSSACELKGQGDANCDEKVDNNDLLIFRREKISGSGTTSDFDGDGKVTSLDLDVFSPTN